MTRGPMQPGPVPPRQDGPEAPSARLEVPVAPEGWAGLPEVLAASARGRAVSLLLEGPAPAGWPSDEELGRLVALGAVDVHVPWPMELGEARPEQSVHFLRFLRDAMSHGLRVRWRGTVAGTLPAWSLSHLEPPALEGATADPSSATWREGHGYGRCYWRAGPGFILVKDCRVKREAARFTLDEPATLRLFSDLAIPGRVAEWLLDAAAERALADLVEEHLVLRLREWVVALPYRMRRWPIPYMAI